MIEYFIEFISDLGTRFKLSVVRTASVTSHEAAMLVFYGLGFACNLRIKDGPELWSCGTITGATGVWAATGGANGIVV